MLCIYVLRIVLVFIYGSVVAAATKGAMMFSFAVGAYSAHGPLGAIIAVLYGVPLASFLWTGQVLVAAMKACCGLEPWKPLSSDFADRTVTRVLDVAGACIDVLAAITPPLVPKQPPEEATATHENRKLAIVNNAKHDRARPDAQTTSTSPNTPTTTMPNISSIPSSSNNITDPQYLEAKWRGWAEREAEKRTRAKVLDFMDAQAKAKAAGGQGGDGASSSSSGSGGGCQGYSIREIIEYMEEEQMSLTREAIIRVMMDQMMERLRCTAADASSATTLGTSDQQQLDTPWQPLGGWGEENDIGAGRRKWRKLHAKEQSEAEKEETRAWQRQQKAARMMEVEAAMARRRAEAMAAGWVA